MWVISELRSPQMLLAKNQEANPKVLLVFRLLQSDCKLQSELPSNRFSRFSWNDRSLNWEPISGFDRWGSLNIFVFSSKLCLKIKYSNPHVSLHNYFVSLQNSYVMSHLKEIRHYKINTVWMSSLNILETSYVLIIYKYFFAGRFFSSERNVNWQKSGWMYKKIWIWMSGQIIWMQWC